VSNDVARCRIINLLDTPSARTQLLRAITRYAGCTRAESRTGSNHTLGHASARDRLVDSREQHSASFRNTTSLKLIALSGTLEPLILSHG